MRLSRKSRSGSVSRDSGSSKAGGNIIKIKKTEQQSEETEQQSEETEGKKIKAYLEARAACRSSRLRSELEVDVGP